jgi:hypothetical protein
MSKYNRVNDVKVVSDPHSSDVNTYNQSSGGRKTIPIGPVLLPIPGNNTFSTNCTTATGLPSLGRSIAVYNNSGAVGSITLGTSPTVTSLAPGVINSAGQAGIPCPPNAWTYISLGNQQFVIASDPTLLCYLIDDGTFLSVENN